MSRYRRSAFALGMFACLTMLTGISGCDESEEIKNWVENTSKMRITALAQSEVVPYRSSQYEALKTYFSEINQMALALKNDSKHSDRFNSAVAKSDLKVICPKVFIERRQWQAIMERCTRNRFFLCSEEVRAYPAMVLALREILIAEPQKKFDQTNDCRNLL